MPDLSEKRVIPVLFEDECYVAFDKPSGILVIPSPKKEKNTLVDVVNRTHGSAQNEFRLHLCHRLDRDTSGVIVFGKGKKNQQAMMQLFHNRQVRKRYIAFVHGKLKTPQGELRSHIRDFGYKKFSKYDSTKLAVTRFHALQIKKGFTVVEVFPITGRTNQIRIQFSEAGFPLVGERQYAFARDFELKFRRVALHAQKFECVHPIYHRPVKIESPLPNDMRDFMTNH